MAEDNHVFQISGIKKAKNRRLLIKGICKLGGKYSGDSVFNCSSSHLIVPQVLPSEKFLAACAAGKWVVTPFYVLDSVKNGSWLPEEPYEVAISTSTKSTFYPTRQWREKVASGKLKGAFQGWRVLLMVQGPSRRAMFSRLLKAGRAKVFHSSPPSYAAITHVIAKPITEDIKFHDAPFYPISHIVQHLFGKRYLDMNFNLTEDKTEESCFAADFHKFELEIKDYIIQHSSLPRFCQFQSHHDTDNSQCQAMDFSHIGTMIECGLVTDAVVSIMRLIFPGVLPPAQYLVALIEYAQQGNATSAFLGYFKQLLYILLVTNPPWMGPNSVKKYFLEVFQCPSCRAGLWPFLESCICYCLLRDSTCHPLPGPALPTLLHFHSDLLAFIVKLFNEELYAIPTRVHLQFPVSESARSTLLLSTFWTVWERSTLLSSAVKRLTQLLIDAASEESPTNTEKQEPHVTETLVDLLSVVVEFWCHHNSKLNQALVEKGLKDFAEHFAVVSHKLSPSALVNIVIGVHSSSLKIALADSVFRCLCCRNGSTVGDDPLCVKKIMQQYLPALEVLSQSDYPCIGEAGPTMQRDSMTDTGTGLESTSAEATVNDTEKVNILKGLNRVNAAGETLLHRACKRNQVETVLKILALPDTDVNVKDHAGWTPLHEACNHGSTECVQALLCHRPAPVVNSQVGGVSPLHDALLTGHMDIAKLLLQHAGSTILQQKNQQGQSPLDLVSDAAQREELLKCALAGDAAQRKRATQVWNLPLLETASSLLIILLTSYQMETGLLAFVQSEARNDSLRQKMLRLLKVHSFEKITSAWTDQRAVRLLKDVQTLMDVGRGRYDDQVSQPIRDCTEENTEILMGELDELKSEGKKLLLLLKKS